MAIRRETIGKQIRRIKAAFKMRDEATGWFINSRAMLTVKRKKITLLGLFVSDNNTFLLRPHLFETKKQGRTAAQWDAWLAENYGEILRENIIPGMDRRTGKQWRLSSIVGVLPNDRTGFANPKVAVQRNKKKRARR